MLSKIFCVPCLIPDHWPCHYLYVRKIFLFSDWSIPDHLFWLEVSDPYVSKLLLLTSNLSSQAEGHFFLFASEDFLLLVESAICWSFWSGMNISDKNSALNFYLFHTWDYSLTCREYIWNAGKSMDEEQMVWIELLHCGVWGTQKQVFDKHSLNNFIKFNKLYIHFFL